jgi:hypothetical protein
VKNKKKKMKLVLSIVFITICTSLQGQINHYWTNQIGARSTMLGGAVVGNVRDNSSIYYNPGGLAFIDKSSISVDGDAAYIDLIKHENGAGDGVHMKNTSLELIPSAFSGTFKDKKRPWLSLNYSIMSHNLSRNSFNAKYSGIEDVMSAHPGDENYLGTYSFANETREDWLVLGRGYRVNERLGLGVSMIFAFLSQTQNENYNISTYVESEEGEVHELGYNINETHLKYNNVGLMAKIGWSYEYDKLRIGGNIASPRLSVYAVSKAFINRNNQISVSPYTEHPTKKALNEDKVPIQYKSPWSVDFGMSYPLSKKSIGYLTLAYFAKINKYNQLRGNVELNKPEEILNPSEENYHAIFKAHKPIVNLAIGYAYQLNDNFSILTGFRTDFSYTDETQLDQDYGYTPTFSNYNIYHLSGGVDYKNNKISLNLGFISAYGSSKGNQQLVNLIDPKDANLLLGSINNTVNSSFLRLGFLFGITYFFKTPDQ